MAPAPPRATPSKGSRDMMGHISGMIRPGTPHYIFLARVLKGLTLIGLKPVSDVMIQLGLIAMASLMATLPVLFERVKAYASSMAEEAFYTFVIMQL